MIKSCADYSLFTEKRNIRHSRDDIYSAYRDSSWATLSTKFCLMLKRMFVRNTSTIDEHRTSTITDFQDGSGTQSSTCYHFPLSLPLSLHSFFPYQPTSHTYLLLPLYQLIFFLDPGMLPFVFLSFSLFLAFLLSDVAPSFIVDQHTQTGRWQFRSPVGLQGNSRESPIIPMNIPTVGRRY